MDAKHYPLQLVLTPRDDGITWELMQKFVAVTDNHTISVPRGFITDFASIPKPARMFFQPATGKYRYASIIHDYLYAYGYKLGINRKESDDIFLELMYKDGVPWYKRYPIYYAVRIGGYSSYLNPGRK